MSRISSILNFKRNNPGEVFSWSLYDFADSAFATTILSVIFNQYFAQVVAFGSQGTVWSFFGAEIRIPGASLFQYAVSISMLLVAISAPVLGTLADFKSAKKGYLGAFCVTGAIFTSLLCFIRAGDFIWGAILFIVANYAFAGGHTFYNALLLEISHPDDMGKISGWGWGLGYLGGGLCLLINLLLLQHPQWLGLAKVEVYYTFPLTALWWLVFSLPILLYVKESKRGSEQAEMKLISVAFQRLRQTFREIKRFRQLVKFLLAYLCFNEGIETIIISASIFGAAEIGLNPAQSIVFFLMVQGSAFIGSLIFGYVVDQIGNKKGLMVTIVVWAGIVLWARFIGFLGAPLKEFYLLGFFAGLVLGGSQSAARSLQGTFTPAEKGAEFFGFFSVCGKFAAMLGPFIYGTAVIITGSLRSGIVVLLGFFILGGILLALVDEEEGRMNAQGSG